MNKKPDRHMIDGVDDDDDDNTKHSHLKTLWEAIAWIIIIFLFVRCTIESDQLGYCNTIKDEDARAQCIIEVSK